LESAGGYLKIGRYALGAASVINGYAIDGLKGAAYGATDAAIETALSTTVIGAGAAWI
jgi:hypothetical protein